MKSTSTASVGITSEESGNELFSRKPFRKPELTITYQDLTVAFGGFPPLAEEGKANVKVLTGYIVETENRKNKTKVIVSRPVYE